MTLLSYISEACNLNEVHASCSIHRYQPGLFNYKITLTGQEARSHLSPLWGSGRGRGKEGFSQDHGKTQISGRKWKSLGNKEQPSSPYFHSWVQSLRQSLWCNLTSTKSYFGVFLRELWTLKINLNNRALIS